MTADVLLPVPVVLPLLGAALCILFGRRPAAQRVVSLVVLSAVVVDAGVLVVRADRIGPQVTQLGGWPAPYGITLIADRLAALLLLTSSLVVLAVLVYAVGQGVAEGRRRATVAIFHPAYLVLSAGVSQAFLTGDLFNLFVAFEVMLAASYVLLTVGGAAPQVRSGMTYVVVSLLSSTLLVVAIGLVYAATGTVNMADLAAKLGDVPAGVRLGLGLTLLVVFGIKAAIFPLYFWLPDSYPASPAPVTAVFAGLLTKVGVYSIIRTQTLLFPGDSAQSEVLLIAALLTMVVGILGAIAQDDLKRVLSFTIVSHIGYMIFGLGLYSAAGLAGAILYIVHHIVVQTTLFLVFGLVERRAGTGALHNLGGLSRLAPATAALFFLPAMSLAGIPPLSGFLAKLALLRAGLAVGSPLAYAVTVAAVVTSLLTLYVVALVWARAFWGPVRTSAPDVRPDHRIAVGVRRMPALMSGATGAAVAGMLAYTVLAGPLYGLAARASQDLLDRVPYQQAVLGQQAPALPAVAGAGSR